MSIASQITALENNISDAYAMVAQRGGTIPQRKNMENLDTAIATIPSGGQQTGIPRDVSSSGVYGKPTSNYSFSLPSGATKLEAWALYYAFYSSLNLTSVDMGSLTEITTSNAATYAFYSCNGLTSVDLGSLETVSGVTALQYAFYSCINLANLDLSSLTTVSGSSSSMSNCFASCRSLTSLDLSSLTTISGSSAMTSCFSGCTSLTTVDLSSLTTVSGSSALSYAFSYDSALSTVKLDSLSVLTGSSALSYAFRNCTSLTSLSFPSLTTSSFGSYTNQFSNMLKSCSGVTVHFPAAIQPTIGGWADVTNGFGGTNTTVLFDL